MLWAFWLSPLSSLLLSFSLECSSFNALKWSSHLGSKKMKILEKARRVFDLCWHHKTAYPSSLPIYRHLAMRKKEKNTYLVKDHGGKAPYPKVSDSEGYRWSLKPASLTWITNDSFASDPRIILEKFWFGGINRKFSDNMRSRKEGRVINMKMCSKSSNKLQRHIKVYQELPRLYLKIHQHDPGIF